MLAKLMTHGIKRWCLACSKSKYVLNLEVYIGKTNEAILELPKHACGSRVAMVFYLIAVWEHRCHTIAMDNFFTMPMLFEDLKRRGFYAIGTTMQGRVGFASSLKVSKKDTLRMSLEIRK